MLTEAIIEVSYVVDRVTRPGNANLRLLHLSTDIGNITFHNGSRTDPGYGIYQPTMLTKALYANIRQRRSILLNSPMVAQEFPHDFHARIETRESDIAFEAVTSMLNAMRYGNESCIEKT
ncbi:hypothetical protein KI688_002515 [Linnemannia hyalina]|uniref:Uncharacterized protein n=1 Tax=Linnemannia hyalina TaxID=64524 RepID=A0A9P7XQE6_9FUNG|nr:hypothetical protein KI688_002515 [Linnemannia hyalina]